MENLIIGLAGSLIVLDTTVAFQFLVSQPIFACTAIGWLLGDPALGLKIGFLLQLLWLSSLPIGATAIPEGNVASIVITTIIIRYSQIYQTPYMIAVIAILYGIAISYFGGRIVVLYRKTNISLLGMLRKYIERGSLNFLSIINLLAVIFHYGLMFLLISLSLFVGDFLFSYYNLIPATLEIYFKRSSMILLGIGAGLILPIMWQNKLKYFVFTGLGMGFILFFLIKS